MNLDDFRRRVEDSQPSTEDGLGYAVTLTAAEARWLLENIDGIHESIIFAQKKLRATQENWQEQCLFECDDALTVAKTHWDRVALELWWRGLTCPEISVKISKSEGRVRKV